MPRARFAVLATIVLAASGLASIARATDPPPFLCTWGAPGSNHPLQYGATRVAVDRLRGRVHVLEGSIIETFTPTGYRLGYRPAQDPLSGVAVTGAGNLIGVFGAAANMAAIEFDLSGAQLRSFISPFAPVWPMAGSYSGAAVAPNGDVYICETDNANRVLRFDSDANFIGSIGAGQFTVPIDVALDTDGNVFVLDTHQVRKFTAAGVPLASWSDEDLGRGPFAYPGGIAVAPDGSVYVADTGNHRIIHLGTDGTVLATWGEPGSGPGELTYPADVDCDDAGDIYVADAGIMKYGSCIGGGDFADGRIFTTVEQLFRARYSTDASHIGWDPGDPWIFDATTLTITREPGVAYFLSGRPDALAGWDCDDKVYVNGATAVTGFDGILDTQLPTCVPMEQVCGRVPARNITNLLPPGTNPVQFRLADTQRALYGNSDIWLVSSTTAGAPGSAPAAGPALLPPYPNPARAGTRVTFDLPTPGRARVEILDLAGRRVRRLVDDPALTAGRHATQWDGTDDRLRPVPPGVYAVRLETEVVTLRRTLVALR